MTAYFKATRPDGTDFHSGTIDYAAALTSGATVRHPHKGRQVVDRPATYLSVATAATDCTGVRWPCRLFRVEPVGRAKKAGSGLPNKRRVRALRVVAEMPAHEVFGPQGVAVAALIERASLLTPTEATALGAAWYAAWHATGDAAWYATGDAARYAAWHAAWHATGDAAWYAGDAAWYATGDAARYAAWHAARDATGDATGDAARYAAWHAAWALVVRDLISVEQFDTLYGPWASVVGPVTA